ncbi:hypothetical protein ACQ4PT_031399 [Festuca glaucescens]
MASASASRALRLSKLSLLPAAPSLALRPLAAAGSLLPAARGPSPAAAPWAAARGFATQPATSSLRDNSPNWSNRPPKETILLDGCDFEHWLVVMDPPPGNPGNPDVPREEIIDTYIKTLAQIVGSNKLIMVGECLKLPCQLNRDEGEPFIDGQAVAYDPKYHEEWVRNSVHAGERIRRGDRPRNFDSNRSRGFDRRSGPAPPSFQPPPPPPPGPNQQMPPRDAPPMRPAQGNFQPQAPLNQQPGYGPGVGPNYPNAPHPGYQPGNQGYPGGNMQSGPGPAYQGNNPGYQSGGPGNPPPPPFPGSNQPPPYQGGGRGYASGAPEQQGQAGNPGYQGSGNYNNNAPLPAYVGRDGPGRHYQ